MTTPAIDRPNLRSPYWIPSNSSNSLNHDHIVEALGHSPDGGETLVFSKLGLTDISVDAAEELATKVDTNGVGVVKRLAIHLRNVDLLNPFKQDSSRKQSFDYAPDRARTPNTSKIPQPQTQQLFIISSCGMCAFPFSVESLTKDTNGL